MSQRLSTSAIFQTLGARVGAVESNFQNGFTPGGIQGALGYVPANQAGDTFTEEMSAPGFTADNGLGRVRLLGSFVSGYAGIIQFERTDGTRSGYVGFNADAGPMQYGSDTGAGHNFFGGPILLDDANIGIKKAGADPVYLCDAGDYLTYNRGTDKFVFVIGGVAVASIDGAGNMRLKGTLIPSVTP